MSRCLPYPPPGYLRGGSRMSVSIENQSNCAKLVPGQSGKGRIQERKYEKEKETKLNYSGDKSLQQVKESGKRKLVVNDKEDSEKSDISEEHGQPVRIFSSVEDKKEEEAASSVPKRNVLRLRLSFKKTKQPDEPVSACQSTSAVSFVSLKKCKESDVPKANKSAINVSLPQTDSLVDTARPCAVELQKDSSAGNVGSLLDKKILSHMSKKHKKELQYEALFRDWVPLPLESQIEENDWLFATKKEVRNDSNRVEVSSNDKFESNSTLWPTSRFLREANIYSLPYTVPF